MVPSATVEVELTKKKLVKSTFPPYGVPLPVVCIVSISLIARQGDGMHVGRAVGVRMIVDNSGRWIA